MKQNKKGFTLIELLVVIAIIGLLSTLAVVALNNARQKSRDAKRVSDAKQIQTALELYFNDCNQYPLLGTAGPLVGTMANGCPTNVSFGTFLAQIPLAPTPADGDCTPTENTYAYTSYDAATTPAVCSTAPCASYSMSFCLGANTGGLTIVNGNCTVSPGGLSCT